MEDGKEKRGKESGTVAAVPEAGSRAYDTCGNQVEKRTGMTERDAVELVENFTHWNLVEQWLDEDDMCEFSEIVKTALEKQIAKKPPLEGDSMDDKGNIIYDTWICPCCNKRYEVDYDNYEHCPDCGQKLDWLEREGEECE